MDDDGVTTTEKFTVTKTDITLKTTINGAVQFMSWVKYYKATQLSCTSGNLYHVQGYILITNHFVEGK